jgi:hypothetical protein
MMRADTTRDSHRPAQHYRHVLQQQGRVGLDAEWNEQRSIDDHLRHTALADVLGDAAGPIGEAAFELTATGATITIGDGRFYVDGILVENDSAVALDAQPHLPAGAPTVLDTDGSPLAAPTPGTYLAELDVWTRLVTALDDSDLREIAVPVPDTTTRAQTIWQVRMVRVDALGADLHCGDPMPSWTALRAPTTGRLRARAEPGDDATTPCEVPAGAGYRGPDNQHYRVEIRDGGTAGTATFVWSRENASVQARWVGQSGNRLTVAIPARDDALGFAPDDWIELVDDLTEATGAPGVMVQIDTVHDDVVEIRPSTVLPAAATIDITAMAANPKIRRWESAPKSTTGSWIPLERGVEVDFENARSYRTGEYWSLPARTAINDLLWPRTGTTPDLRRPAGPDHRYTKLAVLSFDGTAWTVLDDCRELFPPLTDLVTMRYAGGDGQHAAPDPANAATLVALSEPLRVAVANGNHPLAGREVEFTVVAGNGRVDNGSGPAAVALAVTGADGVASVAWSVDSGTDPQEVVARLLTSSGADVDVPVTFSASLLRAGGVTFDTSTCSTLVGITNVQDALEALCAVTRSGCATIVVSPQGDWAAPLRQLPAGSSARICFQPGEYRVEDTIVIADLVDVSLDGAGLGSHLVAERLETLLRFDRCDRVTIRELAISARHVEWPGPADVGRSGAITAVGCGAVTVEHATVTCAGGTQRGTACITVLGRPTGTVVAVRDCTLGVGHLQEGVVVVDGDHVRITDNVVAATRKNDSLSLENLLRSEARRRQLVGQLVADPVFASGGSFEGRGTGIRLGPWITNFDSVVGRAEWMGRIRANPPTEADLETPDTVRRFLLGVADEAVDQPSTFPAFDRRVTELRSSVGATEFARLLDDDAGRISVRSILLGNAIEVLPAAAPTAPARPDSESIEIRLGGAAVRFDSPIPVKPWMEGLRLTGVTSAADDRVLRNALYDVARRILVDASVRDQIPQFRQWFEALIHRNRPAGSTGIVCGGRIADDVDITGNRVSGMIEAIRVAVSSASAAGEAPDRAGTVRIGDNECALAVPIEMEHGRQAIFVGNADRVSVSGNTSSMPGVGRGTAGYSSGVRVHGHLGPRLAVTDNVLDHADVAVRVVALSGAANPHLWFVRDNVGPSAAPAVVAPAAVQVSNNVGR